MKRYVLHTPFNIYHFQEEEWQHPVHKHTYFEIIFILEGEGTHNINGNEFKYCKGDVYLLGPEDYHSFDIREITEFCFIRFNESFTQIKSKNDDSSWRLVLETLFELSSQSRGSVVQDNQEKAKLSSLIRLLEQEYNVGLSPYYEIFRDSIMQSIMIILARSLRASSQTSNGLTYNDSVEAILRYIKKNIYYPSKLCINHLAEEFHLSPAYISIFFKKHTGESIKQYITKHKFNLIEARLIYSQLTIAEISDEFGFTDESHFCKQFKKYKGLTPSEFRSMK